MHRRNFYSEESNRDRGLESRAADSRAVTNFNDAYQPGVGQAAGRNPPGRNYGAGGGVPYDGGYDNQQ